MSDIFAGTRDIVDAEEFRRVAGCFATGVTIVTTTGSDGEPIGLTANSFSSVSLDPPLILFSIARKLNSQPAFQKAEHFSINVLHEGQLSLAKQFAVALGEKWKNVHFEDGSFGCRLISEAAASLECEKYASYDGGDHVIYVGRVLKIKADWQRTPLIFWQGKFGKVALENA
ncbi:flavin reductase family protein [Bradyrhizobium sp. URHD0069]|jgi:flavin reductase (DIM6/NTAB) family NADH-FMN oxidoreductase RutF|uniref:flavin reductase family protein n=1 Tax=Bradyrhizobium sp. URHD0069 TaxID=1380355 RepID=UPI0004966E78|nr:flavin reductase family protein [Bradyrhizobium sp. URHD0069]